MSIDFAAHAAILKEWHESEEYKELRNDPDVEYDDFERIEIIWLRTKLIEARNLKG